MLSAKLVKHEKSGVGHISGIVVVACLICGWSRPAFSVDEPHLQLAPIYMSRYTHGDIGYVFQYSAFGASKTTQQSLGAGAVTGINLASFIWQPWLAQVHSSLSAGVNGTSINNSTNSTYKTVNTSINGDASLNLVSSSRFPFTANIYRNDTRYAAFYSGINEVSQRTGYQLIQDYGSLDHRLKGNASFTSGKSRGQNATPSFSHQFNAGLGYQLARFQTLKISGSSNSLNAPGDGYSYSRDAMTAAHSYRPNDVFAIASDVDLFKMKQGQTQGRTTQQNDFNSQQFSSFASWRPETRPLTMTCGVRYISSENGNNGIFTPAMKASNFNLGANYLFSPFIRMYGSVNVYDDSLGTQTVSTNAVLAASKAYHTRISTNTDLGGFHYSGSIGGSLSTKNTTTTQSLNQTTTSNSLGLGLGLILAHALDKSSELGAGHLSTSLKQTISTGVSSGASGISISNLNTSGSLSWRQAQGKGTTQIRLVASDTRNLSSLHNPSFQMYNLQANRKEPLGRNQSLQGDLTVQATHLGSTNNSSYFDTITPSAAIKYSNGRAFNVKKLTFDSRLAISDSNISPESQHAAARSWDNNFAYAVGQLNMLLKTRLSMAGTNVSTWVLFSIHRKF
jgi:hypothetical protein